MNDPELSRGETTRLDDTEGLRLPPGELKVDGF